MRRSFSSNDYLPILTSLCLLAFMAQPTNSAGSDWVRQPKPSFPTGALESNSEGVVKLRVVVTKEGKVDHAVVVKSSGDRDLDEAAQRGVLTWKMKRGAIKPEDLVQGREVLIDFREEAAVAARYPDRVAAFANASGADMWRSAPFPSYPMEAGRRHQEGTVLLKVKIGTKGNVDQVQVLQTSGSRILDDAAINAVQRWKAHPQYTGKTVALPIEFKASHRRLHLRR
jgi:TonB family protein